MALQLCRPADLAAGGELCPEPLGPLFALVRLAPPASWPRSSPKELRAKHHFKADLKKKEKKKREGESKRRKRKKKGSKPARVQSWGWQTVQGNYPLKLG